MEAIRSEWADKKDQYTEWFDAADSYFEAMGWTEPPNLLHAIIIIIIGWSNKPKLDERFFHRIQFQRR